MSAKQISSALAQLFFPQRHCPLCGALTGKPGPCAACEQRQRALTPCAVCAAFVREQELCNDCAARRPRFSQARAAWPYTGVLRDNLRRFKYREQTWLRRPLAGLLADTYGRYYADIRFDAVLPVPLAPSRMRARGYNQSELLSRNLAAQLQLPHDTGLLTRVLDTPPLASYNGPQRRALLQKAFVAKAAAGKTLLLIDDIYTSGATMNACAAVLCAAGAHEVYGLTVAAYKGRNDF